MKIKEKKEKFQMQEMQKVIQARTESGLTVSEWCQRNNLSEGSDYYWLKKIRTKAIEVMNSRNEIVQIPIRLQSGFQIKSDHSDA